MPQAVRLMDRLGRTCLYVQVTLNTKVVDPNALVFEDDEDYRAEEAVRTNKADWPREPIKERECSGCNGTGFVPVVQPKAPGRRMFAPRCPRCEGKGRIVVKVRT